LKSAESLPRLATIENVFFDKTGTLTTGEFQIEDGQIFENQPDDLRAAVALQARGRHPVARALRRHLIKQGIVGDLQVEGFAELARGGVRGVVQGAVYEMRPDSEGVQVHGNGNRSGLRILLSKDDRVVREFVLRDQLRDEAKEVIDDLQRRGISCTILSGDQRHIVADCAKALGLADEKARARLQPEEKADEIRRVQKTPASGINSNGLNSVQAMMVGDGVNDALAMAEASVGVAVHGSLEASLRTSDVYLLRPRLDLVLKAIDLAKLNRQVIRNDLLLSASYNVMAGGLAASGWMSPLLAAILMPLSSLTVLTVSLWGSERKI
jgi:P-type E1-E2 ATPase